jgi:hypothetical protein
MNETRPPIPASLAHRPVRGGLALPWVNAELADGGVDFRSPHHARYEQCWTGGLCQSCGNATGDPAVLVCGPRQILNRRFDEPPVCPPCALYAGKACPMVSGRTAVYPTRQKLTEGHRGGKCAEGCGCGGWQVTDPEHSADQGGQPALPWYACWIHPAGYTVTAHWAKSRCTDLGCEHDRLIVNGAILNVPPLKIFLVSEPGAGRIWRKLAPDEAAEHATQALGGTP